MKVGCLATGVACAALLALGVYLSFPHPTRDPTVLKAIAAESRLLMAAHPVTPAQIPESQWPRAISSLSPYSVIVRRGMVAITTKPYFDGGWGYGFAPNRQNLSMLAECWSELGHDVYWHGPC